MRGKPQYNSRFPGLLPFDKGQSTIFFGRDKEIKELYYQVCLEKMVVLFGKSGLGKSSLLNAGVSPLLEKNGYLPIRVRFTPPAKTGEAGDNTPNLLIRDFRESFGITGFEKNILYNKESPRLWEFVKAARFSKLVTATDYPILYKYLEEKNLLADAISELMPATDENQVIPVFMFDQFEEFFNHPEKHRKEFLEQLAEITHVETPNRILEWITNIEPEQRKPEEVAWHKQPLIKLVFALRSDRLANMQSMIPFIPTVMRNRYELKPLTKDQAKQAIAEPALKDLGPGYTPPFSFEEKTLEEIVETLGGKSNEIESSQLQIVCHHIEMEVLQLCKDKPGARIRVDHDIIDPVKDFPLILDSFYDKQLEQIGDPGDRERARKLIEDDLVLDGIRESVSKNKMNTVLGISDNLIEELLNTRLLREEVTPRGSVYELSHDTLVAPVEKSKQIRLQEEKERRVNAEKIALQEEARKKDLELEEKHRQLATEIELRERAEFLKRKVASRGKWVFVLLMLLVFAALYLYKDALDEKNRAKKDLGDSQGNAVYTQQMYEDQIRQLIVLQTTNDSLKRLLENDQDTMAAKKSLLDLIVKSDSITKIIEKPDRIPVKDKQIDKLIDSVYYEDFKKEKKDPRTLNRIEKLEFLKKYYNRPDQTPAKITVWPRQENKTGEKQENKVDPKQVNKIDPKQDIKFDPAQQLKVDPKLSTNTSDKKLVNPQPKNMDSKIDTTKNW